MRNNALSIAFFGLFALVLLGQSVVGLLDYNSEQQEHDHPPVAYADYLTSGHFLEAVFENWESEFLQMGMLVILTVALLQRGSAESKQARDDPSDKEPNKRKKSAPWPVRRGGVWLKLYENSLSLALFGLFLMSFALHIVTGAADYNEEQREHGEQPVGTLDYVVQPRFWFESLQNWQSEFLAVGAMAVLTIYLRQKGSPESKPVDSPHYETGSS